MLLKHKADFSPIRQAMGRHRGDHRIGFARAGRRYLQAAVQRHKFGVLHIHNLQETLKKKGVDFPNACQILEICNPQKAKEVLSEDMDLNMALPCRVSVYSEGGKTRIGMMKPSAMLKALSDSPALAEVAQDVEKTIIEMISEAK